MGLRRLVRAHVRDRGTKEQRSFRYEIGRSDERKGRFTMHNVSLDEVKVDVYVRRCG